MVDLGEIQQMMNEYEPNPFVHALIDAANQNGGVDNSTAISPAFFLGFSLTIMADRIASVSGKGRKKPEASFLPLQLGTGLFRRRGI